MKYINIFLVLLAGISLIGLYVFGGNNEMMDKIARVVLYTCIPLMLLLNYRRFTKKGNVSKE